jgi:hypothetical protein
MEIALWIIGIHVFELVGIGIYLLIQKNDKLTNIIRNQSQFIDNISFISSQLNETLGKISDKVYVDGDPELQQTFEELKEFRTLLDSLSKN